MRAGLPSPFFNDRAGFNSGHISLNPVLVRFGARSRRFPKPIPAAQVPMSALTNIGRSVTPDRAQIDLRLRPEAGVTNAHFRPELGPGICHPPTLFRER